MSDNKQPIAMMDPEEDPKHTKITRIELQPDGSSNITEKSYYEQLSHVKEMREKQIPTSQNTLLKDLLDCAAHITSGSSDVWIHLKGRNKEPVTLIKKWVIHKETFNRK